MPQVDIVSRSGERIPVSVWMKRVKQESSLCCVVMLEPVERVSAWVAFRSDVSHVQVPSCGSPYPLGASPPRRVSTWCPPGPWGRKRAWGLEDVPGALLVAVLGQGIRPPWLLFPHLCSWDVSPAPHRMILTLG